MSVQQATDITRTTIIEYRMAIFYGVLFSIGSLIGSTLTALQGTSWVKLDAQAKIMIVLAISGSWITTLLAFISTQAKRIKQTGELFPDDTTVTQQTTGQITQVTQVTTPAIK